MAGSFFLSPSVARAQAIGEKIDIFSAPPCRRKGAVGGNRAAQRPEKRRAGQPPAGIVCILLGALGDAQRGAKCERRVSCLRVERESWRAVLLAKRS